MSTRIVLKYQSGSALREQTEERKCPDGLRRARSALRKPLRVGCVTGPQDDNPDLAAVARRAGLVRVGARPPFGEYLRQVFAHRDFAWSLGAAKAYNRNYNNYLGQLWAVLNPSLLALTYYIVFGLLLATRRGVDNYIAFLVIGIFMFTYVADSLTAGATSVTGNVNLIRALQFPRAVLPLSVALTELLILLPGLAVMVVVVLVSGEPLRWTILAAPGVIVLALLFNAGAAMLAARMVAAARDLRNLIPVATRLLRYFSGVFYSIDTYAGDGILGLLLKYQPFSVYIELMRASLMAEVPMTLDMWIAGLAWALVVASVGLTAFWRAEERYGRD